MAKCSRCGADIEAGKSFCSFCGARVDDNVNKEKNNDFTNMLYGGKDYSNEFDARDIVENKVFCILSYLGLLFIVGLIAQPDSKVVKFHANQGLILFIVEVILGAAGGIIGLIPFVGIIITGIIGMATSVVLIGAFVYQLVNILDGKVKKLPLVGDLTLIKWD